MFLDCRWRKWEKTHTDWDSSQEPSCSSDDANIQIWSVFFCNVKCGYCLSNRCFRQYRRESCGKLPVGREEAGGLHTAPHTKQPARPNLLSPSAHFQGQACVFPPGCSAGKMNEYNHTQLIQQHIRQILK